jgi:hypothetical protein
MLHHIPYCYLSYSESKARVVIFSLAYPDGLDSGGNPHIRRQDLYFIDRDPRARQLVV